MENEKLAKAEKNFCAGKNNNAIAYCKQILSENPKNIEAMLLLGRAYLANLDDEAFEIFEMVKKLKPNLAAGYFYKGRAILYLGNNYEVAVENFDKAIELDATNAETYFLRGDAQARLKNFVEAAEDFTKALEMKPAEKIYKKRGEVYLELKNFSAAIEDFNKVLEFSAEKSAYKGLAIAYANLKNKKLALANFDKFVELSKEKNFYKELGEIYLALCEYESAVENFSKHIELDKFTLESYYLRGRSYFEQKNFEKALSDFEEYVTTLYEVMSEGCYFSESETNYESAKKFCEQCKEILKNN